MRRKGKLHQTASNTDATTSMIVERPTGSTSYADMVRLVKTMVRDKSLTIDITTKRPKLGNIILEIPEKSQADDLASALRSKLGEKVGIRRAFPSIPLLFVRIEDSVDDPELRATVAAFDKKLQDLKPINIRTGKNSIRSAIVRVHHRPELKLIEEKKLKIGWVVSRITRTLTL